MTKMKTLPAKLPRQAYTFVQSFPTFASGEGAYWKALNVNTFQMKSCF